VPLAIAAPDAEVGFDVDLEPTGRTERVHATAEPLTDAPPGPGMTAPTPRPPRRPLFAAVTALALVVLVGVALARGRSEPAPPTTVVTDAGTSTVVDAGTALVVDAGAAVADAGAAVVVDASAAVADAGTAVIVDAGAAVVVDAGAAVADAGTAVIVDAGANSVVDAAPASPPRRRPAPGSKLDVALKRVEKATGGSPAYLLETVRNVCGRSFCGDVARDDAFVKNVDACRLRCTDWLLSR
jgi:hypothetical protein